MNCFCPAISLAAHFSISFQPTLLNTSYWSICAKNVSLYIFTDCCSEFGKYVFNRLKYAGAYRLEFAIGIYILEFLTIISYN